MKIHPAITEKVLCEAIERRETTLDNPGFCVKCGEEQEGCEPDARGYECEVCETKTVYAPEELLYHFSMREDRQDSGQEEKEISE